MEEKKNAYMECICDAAQKYMGIDDEMKIRVAHIIFSCNNIQASRSMRTWVSETDDYRRSTA